MSKKPGSHHVAPDADGGWDVKKDGATRSSGHFDKKQDAVDVGRKISQNQGTGCAKYVCLIGWLTQNKVIFAYRVF